MHEPSPLPATRPRRFTGAWARALPLLLACAGLVLVASSDSLHAFLLDLLKGAESFIRRSPVLGAVLFVLLSALSAMLAFFSSAVLVPVALYTWGVTLCTILLWTGWILGGAVAYGIARFLGRPVVGSLVPRAKLAEYGDLISRRTPFVLVLLFQLAVPSEIPGYLLGLVRYRFWRYLAALGLAELPYAVGTVYLGAGLVDRKPALLVGVTLAGAALILGAFTLLQRRLRAQRRLGGRGPGAPRRRWSRRGTRRGLRE